MHHNHIDGGDGDGGGGDGGASMEGRNEFHSNTFRTDLPIKRLSYLLIPFSMNNIFLSYLIYNQLLTTINFNLVIFWLFSLHFQARSIPNSKWQITIANNISKKIIGNYVTQPKFNINWKTKRQIKLILTSKSNEAEMKSYSKRIKVKS